MHLSQPHRIEPRGFSQVHQVKGFLERFLVRASLAQDEVQKYTEIHTLPPS
jgi:hypothetical protein